jgi:hypothetical protein
MTTKTVEESNAELRAAVEARLKNAAAGKPAENWYDSVEAAGSCCEGGKCLPPPAVRRLHPGSLAFMEVMEEIKAIHIRKSQDYGEPTDPLANVKAGAELVGIEPWRGCIVRMADKMQRIRTYCREGALANEGFEDALLDLASYAAIALVLFRQEQGHSAA